MGHWICWRWLFTVGVWRSLSWLLSALLLSHFLTASVYKVWGQSILAKSPAVNPLTFTSAGVDEWVCMCVCLPTFAESRQPAVVWFVACGQVPQISCLSSQSLSLSRHLGFCPWLTLWSGGGASPSSSRWRSDLRQGDDGGHFVAGAN